MLPLKSLEIYKDIFDTMLEGVQVLDKNYAYVYINKAAATHGRSTPDELIGNKITEMYPKIEQTPLFDLIKNCLEYRASSSLENKFTQNDGSIGWYKLIIEPQFDGVLIFSIDITKEKAHSLQQAKIEKLEAIELITLGFAHDLNNKLTIFELAFELISKDHKIKDSIKETIRLNLKSSKELIQVLQCEVSENNEGSTDIDQFLVDLSAQYKEFLGKDINFKVESLSSPLEVIFSQAQLDQIFLNLLVNAKHAIDGKGSISVTSRIIDISDLKGMHPLGLSEGKYCQVHVKDNGCGMSPVVANKIFDFYFTTKSETENSGLGLSTVNRILSKRNSCITVDTEEGKGSTFTLWLKAK